MSVRQVLGALGAWNVVFTDELPEEVRAKIDFFGHVLILRGSVDLTEHDGGALLAAARYVGVVRRIDLTDRREIGGDSMVVWLGDEDEKGAVIENKITVTNSTLTAAVSAILPAAVTLGTVHPLANPAQRYTGSFQYETPRSALQRICDAFGVEYRVNGNATVDIGRSDQLYAATPDSIVVRRGAGVDMDLVALGGQFEVDTSAIDYSDRVLLVGKKQDDSTFTVGAADVPSTPYRDLLGNPVKRTRMISESGTETGSVAQRAQLHLNRFARVTKSLKVTADDFEVEGNFVVGDMTYVYDPDTGIVNPANEVFFRGDVLHPDIVRISELGWSVTDDHTVVYRTAAGEFVDLTRWVAFETGTNEVVVGDLPRSLLGPTSNPVKDRADALPDASVPAAPQNLQLATTSTVTPAGQNVATVLASWDAPGANTDGTPLLDLSHFVIRYRPNFRSPNWTVGYADTVTFDFPATVGLPYDVQVAAVDKAGNTSAYTPVSSITASADTTAPTPPSDPSVTSYLGQLRIEWDGLTAAGQAMPPDFSRVDVHVGTVAGFTPAAATLVDSLATKGVSYATAPYASTRYVRLIAYDRSGNASAASGTVSGATTKVADGDIAALSVGKLTAGIMLADVTVAGRFATALTGARTELNALGLQKWDSAGNLLVSITGTEALLTGTYKSALSGRRVEIGSAGAIGQVNFYAPDGTFMLVQAFTSTNGNEAIRVGTGPLSGVWSGWGTVQAERPGLLFWYGDLAQFVVGGNGPGTVKDFLVGWAATRGTTGASPAWTTRMWVNESITQIAAPDGGGSASGTRHDLNNGKHAFYLDTKESMRLETNGNPSQGSALIQGFTGQASNGGFYGAAWRMSMGSPGVGVGWDARYFDDSVYIPVRASAFDVQSSEAEKTDIAELTGSALEIVGRMKPKKYRRKPPTVSALRAVQKRVGKDRLIVEHEPATDLPAPEQREQIGLIAEEAPAEVVVPVGMDGLGVDLYAMASLTVAGLNELAARVAAMERGGRP